MPEDDYLDGDPADYPQRQEAMEEYRAAWISFLLGESEPFLPGESNRRYPTAEARRRMDAAQLLISKGPGPIWQAFMATLPGCNEWWAGATDEIMQKFSEKVRGSLTPVDQ